VTSERTTAPGQPFTWIDTLSLVACALLAYGLNAYVGRIGYMALDQSIVFDGGWRLLSGQVPWRDFMTPNGLVPMALQAVVFAVSGVTWSGYVAHAGLVNAAGAVVVLLFLRVAGLGTWPAVATSVATALWLYPLMGTPYMDQHSLFFAGVALLACWHAAATDRRGWWAVAGVAAALGILSKQVPAVVFLPLSGLTLFMAPTRRVATGLAISLTSALIVITLAFGSVVALGARPADILESFWSVPVELGRLRMADPAAGFFSQLRILRLVLPLSYWTILGLFVGTLIAFLQPALRRTGLSSARSGLTYSAAGLGLLVATVQAFSVTFNSETLLMGWMPLAVALMLLGLKQLVEASDDEPRRSRLRLLMQATTVVVPLLVVVDAVEGYRNVALPRRANDMVVTAAERAQPLPDGLLRSTGFAVWKVPKPYVSASDSFERLLGFFAQRPGNLLIIGDETILYGLTGRPSVTPFVWFHPGLTFRREAKTYAHLEQLLDASLRKHAVRWIVIPANPSWMGWNRRTWVSLRQNLAGASCEQVGTYEVCDVASKYSSRAPHHLDTAVESVVGFRYVAYQSR
jgi:hypothetical protein